MSVRSNKARVVFRPGERSALEALARDAPAAVALRARIVLACAAGQTNQQAAQALGTSPSTVGRWRGTFLQGRVEALAGDTPPRAERSDHELQRWERVLEEVAHDRELLGLAAGLATAPAVAAALERVAESVIRRLRIVPLTKGGVDASGTADLLEAALDAASTAQFTSEVDEFGSEAILPNVAAHLLTLADAARRSRDAHTRQQRAASTRTTPATKPYRATETFAVGDRIEHPKFGAGRVIAAADRILVRFASGERHLAHAKPAAAAIAVSTKPRPVPRSRIPEAAVRRVAPDPRLTQPDDEPEVVFAHLAKARDPDDAVD